MLAMSRSSCDGLRSSHFGLEKPFAFRPRAWCSDGIVVCIIFSAVSWETVSGQFSAVYSSSAARAERGLSF
jgi:hypothetical protein